MKVIEIKDLNKSYFDCEISLAIGNFDGLHLGHLSIIDSLKKFNTKTAILTFDPHPKAYFNNKDYKYLTSLEDKIKLLDNKIDYFIIMPFNDSVRNLNKMKFISILINNNVRNIICGLDFKFGRNQEGDIDYLGKYFNLEIQEDIISDDTRISSSKIKEYLLNGDILKVNRSLDRPYMIKGIVEKGKELGREIGFPTANFSNSKYVLPKNGVYATLTLIDGVLYRSITNIGINPTVSIDNDIKVETYILDFDEDLYNKEITLLFYNRIRDEHKFSSLEELKLQLEKDKLSVVNFFEKILN